MRTLLIALALIAATSATSFAGTAYWTGRQEQVQTVTYQFAWNCEYNYFGQTFWRIFKNYCPSQVEVY